MKELSSWALGLVLSGWYVLYQIKLFILQDDINMTMAITVGIFTIVWWAYKIKAQRKDFKNKEIIEKTLLMEQKEVLDRIARNTEIAATIKPKEIGKDSSKDIIGN